MSKETVEAPSRSAIAFASLAQMIAKDPEGLEAPKIKNGRLSMEALQTKRELFQPRWGTTSWHVEDLERALKINGDLDPLLVFRAGKDWFVIDGHHRLEAYENLQRPEAPVRVFEGTLAEALKAAGRASAKAVLTPTNQERQNYAWRLVCLRCFNNPEVEKASGVSRSQVKRMKNTREELGTEVNGDMQWWQVRRAAKGLGAKEEMSMEERRDWMEEQSDNYAKRLEREFSRVLRGNSQVTGMAFAKFFGRSSAEVIQAWQDVVDIDPEEDF